jgi:hypothetical protein
MPDTYTTPIIVIEPGLTQRQKDKRVRDVISALPAGYVASAVHWPDYIEIYSEVIDNSKQTRFFVDCVKLPC